MKNGGFLKSISCQGRVFKYVFILDSYSEKTTIGFRLLDNEMIDCEGNGRCEIIIENSVFFNNFVYILNNDNSYGVAIFLNTPVTTILNNLFIAVIFFLIFNFLFFYFQVKLYPF